MTVSGMHSCLHAISHTCIPQQHTDQRMSCRRPSTLRCMRTSVSSTAVPDQCMWPVHGMTVSGMHSCLHAISHTCNPQRRHKPVHVVPSPEYPALHVHDRDPGSALSVQRALAAQGRKVHAFVPAKMKVRYKTNTYFDMQWTQTPAQADTSTR